MTQIFTENGTGWLGTLFVEAGPCVVRRKIWTLAAVAQAVQLAYGDVKREEKEEVTKLLKGHYDKHGVE